LTSEPYRVGAVGRFSNHFQAGLCLKQAAKTIPKNRVVVSNDDPNILRSLIVHNRLPYAAVQ
jgi:hypothetical protein